MKCTASWFVNHLLVKQWAVACQFKGILHSQCAHVSTITISRGIASDHEVTTHRDCIYHSLHISLGKIIINLLHDLHSRGTYHQVAGGHSWFRRFVQIDKTVRDKPELSTKVACAGSTALPKRVVIPPSTRETISRRSMEADVMTCLGVCLWSFPATCSLTKARGRVRYTHGDVFSSCNMIRVSPTFIPFPSQFVMLYTEGVVSLRFVRRLIGCITSLLTTKCYRIIFIHRLSFTSTV